MTILLAERLLDRNGYRDAVWSLTGGRNWPSLQKRPGTIRRGDQSTNNQPHHEQDQLVFLSECIIILYVTQPQTNIVYEMSFGKCVFYPLHQPGWSLTPRNKESMNSQLQNKREPLPRSHLRRTNEPTLANHCGQYKTQRRTSLRTFTLPQSTVRKAAPPVPPLASCPLLPAAGHNRTQAVESVQIGKKEVLHDQGGIEFATKSFLSEQCLHSG